MELLINAEKAYNEAIDSRKNREELLYRDMMECLNKDIVHAVKAGQMGCVNDWTDFSDKDIFSTNLIDRFLKDALQAGYDVEFYYESATGYNPCGIVVVWGSDREREMNHIFETHNAIYRGETNELS